MSLEMGVGNEFHPETFHFGRQGIGENRRPLLDVLGSISVATDHYDHRILKITAGMEFSELVLDQEIDQGCRFDFRKDRNSQQQEYQQQTRSTMANEGNPAPAMGHQKLSRKTTSSKGNCPERIRAGSSALPMVTAMMMS